METVTSEAACKQTHAIWERCLQ